MYTAGFPPSSSAEVFVLIGTGVVSYLIGALPFGYIAAKLAGVGDIRQLGSGNTGATNVARTLGPAWGLAVLLLDVAKGAFGAGLGLRFFPWGRAGGLVTGLLAVAGHNWPVFLKFRGGKGVATTFGMVLALYPGLALFSSVVFLLTVLIARYVSLGSLVGSWAAFGVTFLLSGYGWLDRLAIGAFCLLITVRHKENLRRLVSGSERRVDELMRRRTLERTGTGRGK